MRKQVASLILEAIEPSRQSVDANELRYPHLRASLKHFGPKRYLARSSKLISTNPIRHLPKPGELKQELNTAYLLTASYRLQKSYTPVDKLFWSQQFTLASVGLFGRPDPKQVRKLAATEYKYFNSLASELSGHYEFTHILLNQYRQLAGRAKPGRSLDERFSLVLARVKTYFYHNYAQAFAVFDNLNPNKPLQPKDVRKYYRLALKELIKLDKAWQDWQVISNQTAGLSVQAANKQIIIGRYRAAIWPSEIRGLFAHEVLVHANRALQGAKLSHDLGLGLDGYLAAEEGLGVVAEAAINGKVPVKIKDRYLDTAMALGNYRRRSVNRGQMFNIFYVRAVLRSLDGGHNLDLDDLEKATWQNVNRIYRGGLGDKYVAVFTKDVAYYEGFIKMARYFDDKRKTDKLKSSLDFVMQGKFDPTNKDHVYLVKQAKLNKSKKHNN